MQPLIRPILFCQLILLAALWGASFLVGAELFEGLITAKQRGVEVVVLFSISLLVFLLLFRKRVYFTIVDILIILFCGWSLINEAIILNSPFADFSLHLFTISLWLFVYLFLRSISDKTILLYGVAILWVIFSLLHSVLGLMQLYGFAVSHHGLFSITGAFHNPGPFSGFVVSGLPLALAMILFAKSQAAIPSKKLFYQTLYYLLQISAWITLVSILLVLPPAQSRAAWIAGIIGVTFFVFRFPGKISVRDSFVSRFKRMKRRVRLLISILVLAVVVASATGIYLFKQGSADGRLLIWRVTTEIIKQKAFVGHGTDAFNALYMDEQANWFASGKGNEAQAMVAGSPRAPFNELLKLWLEKGFVGVLIAGVIVFYILRDYKYQKISPIIKQTSSERLPSQEGLIIGLQGALITLLVFSLFSYPFDISPFLLQLVVAVAVLAGYSKRVIQLNKIKKWLATIPFSLLLVFATIHFVPQRKVYYQALKTWHEADYLYHFGTYNSAVEAYEAVVPILKTNGLFLQMYGKALSMDKQYEKSSEVLVQAQKKCSSQIIQNTLGDNHKALGNFVKAETDYLKSANMNPSLIYPKYLLAKLYNENGQHQKAQQTAEKILNSNVKVESLATKEMMREMKNIVSEQ